jgi:Flp pilus assembly protein CpaB
MQGRTRILIIVIFLLVIVGVGAFFLMNQTDNEADPSPAPSVEQPSGASPTPVQPSATPLPTQALTDIIVAVQAISRGSVIPAEAIRLQPWPAEAAPFNAVLSLEDVIGKRARTDIYVEQPILTSYLVEGLDDLADVGSDAAAVLPNGTVGVAMPMDRLTSVAYAIQPGDRVDIVISLLFIDIDEQFQSALPNSINLVNTAANENGISLSLGTDVNGRFETERIPLPGFNATLGTAQQTPIDWPVLIRPSESPRPRLVTQRTIQDALVVHTGNFPEDGRLFGFVPTPTPVPAEGATPVPQGAAPAPTAVPPRPDIVTLAVTPQEAVILTWMVEAGVPITFLLRAAADTSQVPTDQVTLDYILASYSITIPGKQAFSIQPAIRSIRQLRVGNTISLGN